MSEGRLPLYCAHNGVVAMATLSYDRNSTSRGIFLAVSASTVNWTHVWNLDCQCETTQQKKYKRLSCWYCHTVVSFGWLHKQFNNWFSLLQYYSAITECNGTCLFWWQLLCWLKYCLWETCTRYKAVWYLWHHMCMRVCEEGPTVKWWLILPPLVCPQWPLPLVVPPPHAHVPPDMHTSWLSNHSGVQPITRGAHSEEEHELIPTGLFAHCFTEMCTTCRIILLFP